VLETVEVDGARVAGDEAEALLLLDPGLHLDPVVGRDPAATGDVLFVGEVAVLPDMKKRSFLARQPELRGSA
jgi:hypothetical protein